MAPFFQSLVQTHQKNTNVCISSKSADRQTNSLYIDLSVSMSVYVYLSASSSIYALTEN